MAMELVIKIPEESYKATCNGCMLPPHVENVVQAIRNGIPLPKGHGGLIDTKEFIKSINDWADNIDNYGAYEELEIAKALLQNHAHTIIEADKEN